MNSLLLYLYAALLMLLLSGCIFVLPGDDPPCRDAYGSILHLDVPIQSLPTQDTFRIGDTIWIIAEIDKDVSVIGRGQTLRLDSFNFFTELAVSEISGSEEDFVVDIDITTNVGHIDTFIYSSGAVTFPIFYEETMQEYRFEGVIVINQIGRYYLTFNTGYEVYERYRHPAILCDGNFREEVRVLYTNPSTTYSNYENILTASGVPYLQTGSFERRQSIGAHAFIVTE